MCVKVDSLLSRVERLIEKAFRAQGNPEFEDALAKARVSLETAGEEVDRMESSYGEDFAKAYIDRYNAAEKALRNLNGT